MMIGLPGDTKEKALRTAQRIADFGAACTRIYPTLVVPHTRLALDYAEGRYQPLSLEEAVDWCKDLYLFFQEKNITVLRMGLHPSEGLLSGKGYIAGPFHVSFKELVMSAIWHDRILEQLHGDPQAEAIIKVPAGEINYAVGYGGANKKRFPNAHYLIEN
jgi:histone acetyltransferase (RNA polymerase elongator complex component)